MVSMNIARRVPVDLNKHWASTAGAKVSAQLRGRGVLGKSIYHIWSRNNRKVGVVQHARAIPTAATRTRSRDGRELRLQLQCFSVPPAQAGDAHVCGHISTGQLEA